MMSEINPMKGVCMVCGVTYREGEEPPSHGFCPECYRKAMDDLGNSFVGPCEPVEVVEIVDLP